MVLLGRAGGEAGEVEGVAGRFEDFSGDGDGGEGVGVDLMPGRVGVCQEGGVDKGVHEVYEAAGVFAELGGENLGGEVDEAILQGVVFVYVEVVVAGCYFFHGVFLVRI